MVEDGLRDGEKKDLRLGMQQKCMGSSSILR